MVRPLPLTMEFFMGGVKSKMELGSPPNPIEKKLKAGYTILISSYQHFQMLLTVTSQYATSLLVEQHYRLPYIV